MLQLLVAFRLRRRLGLLACEYQMAGEIMHSQLYRCSEAATVFAVLVADLATMYIHSYPKKITFMVFLKCCGCGKRSPATGPLSWYTKAAPPRVCHASTPTPLLSPTPDSIPSLLAASSCPTANTWRYVGAIPDPPLNIIACGVTASAQAKRTVKNSHRSHKWPPDMPSG